MQKKTQHTQKIQNPPKPLRIDFLLYDRFSNLCLANCLEPFRAVNALSNQPLIEWHFFTLDGRAVKSSSELPISPEGALDAKVSRDFLFIIASYDYVKHDNLQSRQMLKQCASHSKVIAGLDTGSWHMASAGLLKGMRATIHPDVVNEFSEKFLNVRVEKQRFIFDDNRITCAGALAAFNLSIELIKTHFGATLALDVTLLFLQDQGQNDILEHQTKSHAPPIKHALKLMQENLEEPLGIVQIANRLEISEKRLLRLFLENFEMSPRAIYCHLRLSYARHLLTTTHLDINEISIRCGYDNHSAFSRAFKTQFKVTPLKLRNQFWPK